MTEAEKIKAQLETLEFVKGIVEQEHAEIEEGWEREGEQLLAARLETVLATEISKARFQLKQATRVYTGQSFG